MTGAGRGFCPGADMDGLAAAAGSQGEVGGGGGGGSGRGTGARTAPDTRPMIYPTMIGKGTADGRYTVYACCTAYFYVKLLPPHPGSPWVATVQYLSKRGWRQLGQATYRFEHDGDAAIYLNASTGFRYRVRGRWKGDANNLAATSAWRYFRYR